jgi:hypothetical protein
MTHKKMNSKIFNQNRDGITLLFVISMVVLFLLMGTTFMVISNDYYKAARRRSRRSTNIVNPPALLDRCFYDLFRGPDLRDVESPLRGHSILADQYGYGIIGTLEQVFREAPTGVANLNPFVQLRLSIADADTRRQFEVFGSTNNPFSPTLMPIKERFFSGRLNGQVISIVDGQYDGFSGRIVSSDYDNPTAPEQLVIHVLPSEILSPDRQDVTTEAEKNMLRDNLRVQAAAGEDVFSTVVINGRDFSGIGNGDLATNPYGPPGATTPGSLSATYRFDVDAAGGAAVNYLGTEALAPNRFGESFDNLVGDPTDYLARENSPNEPYDAADFQNMFLSTTLPGTNMVIPSFHRDTFYSSQYMPGATADEIRSYSFRPVRVSDPFAGPPVVDFADTANADFAFLGSFQADGSLSPGTANMATNLDVDSDGDGALDAVWIDIGLPTQTDDEGRVFRPLVAYRVLDLDNRLNLNAHGNFADEQRGAGPITSLGSGYGVAEISLRVPGITDVVSSLGSNPTLYDQLLRQRYGNDNVAGLDTNAPEVQSLSVDDGLGRNQKLFSYPENPREFGGADQSSFNSAFDLLGQFEIATNVAGTNDELPGFTRLPVDANFVTNPYNVSFSLDGSAGDNFFTAVELEGLLRANDPDSRLMSSRLNPLVTQNVELFPALGAGLSDFFTTHSFEVNMPATGRSLPERINDLIPNAVVEPTRSILINDLTPREVIFGGKLNINRYLGNGVDDDNDGIVDEIGEPDFQRTAQEGNPTFSTVLARQSLVRDLYLTFLLACGDTPPVTFTYTGASGNANIEYHRMVAQWAVNIVDFRDADSINTPYVFDPTPFDGTPLVVAANPLLTVWGCERPEILISETFAFHDRQNQDAGVGGRTTDSNTPDDDWDSIMEPVSGAVIELYNPWNVSTSFQRIGSEIGNPNNGNVNLSATTGNGGGGDPVWRIALKRSRSVSDVTESDVLRTVFFVEPNNATVQAGTDAFFPSSDSLTLGPGQYGTLKPVTGNDVTVGLETLAGIANQRSVFIDSSLDNAGAAITSPSRVLNISDPSGGYTPGFPRDQPADSRVQAGAKSNRTSADLSRLWVNGVVDNYRFVYLQRLANPTLAWNATTNPYLTVDTAGIDLLGMNTTNISGASPYTRENGATDGENGVDAAGTFTATDGATRYRSVERGETFAATGVALARQSLFHADDGPMVSADDFSAFQHSFGRVNVSHDDSGLGVAARTPFGWLPWNNRPFASHMELLNVPFTSQGMMTYALSSTPGAGASDFDTFKTGVSATFGDGRFGQLLNFSAPLGAGANRFAHFLEFVETPSLFLGMETYLPGNLALIRNSLNLEGNAFTEFHPRVHGIPNFRTPGKINLNTISPLQTAVWANLTSGFTMPLGGFLTSRAGTPGITDFANLYTTAENASFVERDARAGSESTMFNGDPSKSPTFSSVGLTNTATPQMKKDLTGSSYFANEFRQKMGNMVTTRSSVFAIWITVGYFQVDQFGRLGAELATESGQVTRNRGFYIVDRSIPVAFEPGKNHNVDKAVLVRSIIE